MDNQTLNTQIKSKKRVNEFGEVFTKEQEINGMLNLIKDESARVDSKFLEPTCGHGNFLVKILERKLNTINDMDLHDINEYEKQVFLAVSSIYGIDILEDNILECRMKIFNIIEKDYKTKFKDLYDINFLKSIKYVIYKNIICGDTLNEVTCNNEPIIFSEWTIKNNMVQRKDYSMNDIIDYNEDKFNSKLVPLLPIKSYSKINLKEVFLVD